MPTEEEFRKVAATLNAMDVPKRSKAEIQMLVEVQTLREALAKLSPEDRASYQRDYEVFGNAMIEERDDGTVVYVPLKDWKEANNGG